MRAFAQKPEAARNAGPTGSAKPGVFSGRSHAARSILGLQHAIGNQAVQRLVPGNAGAPATIQAKLTVNTPGDIYEQEADRIAGQVMSMPEASTQRTCACGGACPSCKAEQWKHERLQTKRIEASDSGHINVPPTVHTVLASRGQPLDAPARAFMESRFGHDFSQVQIHTDERAAESARHMGAAAYTAGANAVFGAGRYAPRTATGKRLLAHELTHVVQQSQGGSPAHSTIVQRAPATVAAPPFYQEVLDAIAAEERTVVHLIRSSFGGWALPFLRKVERLSKAVEAEDKKAIPALVTDLLKEYGSPLAPYVRSDKFVRELVSRTYLLGLDAEAAKLYAYFREIETRHSSRLKSYSPERYLWETLIENALARMNLKTAPAALRSLELLLQSFKVIRDEAASLDRDAIKRDVELRRLYANDPFGLAFSGNTSISAYEAELHSMLIGLAQPVQRAFQVLMDAAISDLESGKGEASLDVAKSTLETKIKPVMHLEVEGKFAGNLMVDITRSKFEKRGGRHLDYFLQGKAAQQRSAKFTYYDKDYSTELEKPMPLGRVFEIRQKQIAFLEEAYGRGKDPKTGAVTAESRQHADIIAKGTRLRLDNIDDWREFLLEKYKAQLVAHSQDKGKALVSLVDFLQRYLTAFTVHTPYNIEDFGDNYLTKTFPRALTGQLIHDCGVYALRVAYILSRVRAELNLRFRFVRLPVHVGLVITGESLPVFMVHNNSINTIEPAKLKELEDQWRLRDPAGNLLTAPRAANEGQFLAEMAAGFFITKVDMPYRFEEMSSFAEKGLKDRFWTFYQSKLNPDVLGSQATEGDQQLHLQYLKLIGDYKHLYNTEVSKFWNIKAHELWKAHSEALLPILSSVQRQRTDKDRQGVTGMYAKAVKTYRDALDGAFKPVKEGLEKITAEKIRVSDLLTANPKFVAKGASVAHARRSPADFQWNLTFADYLFELENMNNLLDPNKSKLITPPFAKREDFLGRID